jgi:hypothetical protein
MGLFNPSKIARDSHIKRPRYFTTFSGVSKACRALGLINRFTLLLVRQEPLRKYVLKME